jgi:hypothetical protein
LISSGPAADPAPAVTFNKNFEGASLGTVEKLDDATFRCHVEGQYDERGRNRQASWHYFRMDHVKGRALTLTFTDYVGEYNDKPGACPMNADLRPVFSYDNERWRHFEDLAWDDVKKEATITLTPEQDTVWIAHQQPYTHAKLLRLLADLDHSPHARIEVIGKTVQGRDLHLVTVTDFSIPDDRKKTVWLQARQHAWESGTSFTMEGALKFVASDDPQARELRRKVVFKFTPMMDPDGSAGGKVRFNANGYDVNRHWDEVDLRNKEILRLMPEIWYVKKTLFAYVDSGRRIDVMVNLHNTETAEYLDTTADDEASQAMFQRLFATLVEKSIFDPSRKLGITLGPSNTTNSLYREKKIPVALMELRVATSKKLERRPTAEDRLKYGAQLIRAMASAVLE